MRGGTVHQSRLRFEDDLLWERLPEKTRQRCLRLLSLLLRAVLEAEREEVDDE